MLPAQWEERKKRGSGAASAGCKDGDVIAGVRRLNSRLRRYDGGNRICWSCSHVQKDSERVKR